MAAPRIEIICVGTELLTGRVNTHTAYIGLKLAELGLSIHREHTLPDDEAVMREAFREALKRADIVFSCGGLGPTFDDITRDMWSSVTGRKLRPNASLARDIQAKFAARKLVMPSANLRQADVLTGAVPLFNPNGTAPGQFLKMGRKVLFLLPGPGRELYPMFENIVMPRLKRLFVSNHSKLKTFLIAGVPESRIDQLVRPLVEKYQRVDGCLVTHGILASHSLITVKFRVEGRQLPVVKKAFQKLTIEFRRCLKDFAIAEDEEAIEDVVGALLASRNETLALAESCTGGLISKMLTDRPGASAYMMSGVVAYSNAAKTRALGVPARLFSRRGPGAVSEAVARAMAEGARQRANTDFGLSVTGVAGPRADGAKPVGLVFIGCASRTKTVVKQFNFNGDRAWIRQRSAVTALDILRQHVLGRLH